MNRNFRIGDKVVILATDTVEDIYGRYELIGRLGEIRQIIDDDNTFRRIGIHIPGEDNSYSALGLFWLDVESLELFDRPNDRPKEQALNLLPYDRVAFVTVDGSVQEYAYALYDEPNNRIQPTDYVLVSGKAEGKLCFITKILPKEEVKNKVTEEVICKVDLSAYRQRQDIKRKKQKLLAKMKAKRRELEARKLDEMYASIDEDYAKMLDELKSIG
jgi:hypothetical protein